MPDNLTVDIVGGNVSLPALLDKVQAQMLADEAQAQALQRSFAELGAGNANAALAEMDGLLGKVTADTEAGTAASLASARVEAQLAVAVGDHAGAIGILEAELAQQTVRTDAVVRAEIQLTTVENQLIATQEKEAAAAAAAAAALAEEQAASSGLNGAIGGATSAMGALGVGMTAIVGVKLAVDLAETGAQAQQTETRFNSLAASAGTTGAALLAALRDASGGEIKNSALELDVMKASLLGVGSSAAQLAPLLSLARDRAQEMGLTTDQAFERLVTGLGRGSAKILDDLGIVVHITQVNDQYAASIGKTADQLSDVEKKQALVNEVMRQGAASAAANGGAIAGTAGQIAQGKAGIDNLKESVGELAAIKLGPLAADIGKVTNALAGAGSIKDAFGGGIDLASKFNPAIDTVRTLTAAVDGATISVGKLVGIPIPDTFSPLRDSINQWLGLLGLAPAAAQNVVTAVDTMASARERERAATNAARDSMEAYRALEVQSASDTAASTSAQLALANSIEIASAQARAGAAAAEQKSNADQLAAVNAQTHTAAEDALASAAQRAAQVLLASGASGASAAAQLANSSQQVDVLTAAFYRLAAAQAAAGHAATLAKLEGQTARQLTGADSDEADIRNQRRSAIAEDRTQRIAAADDASAAEAKYQAQLGNEVPTLNRLKAERDQMIRSGQAGSAAYFDLLTKIDQAEDKSAKNAKGKAGGAVKLSDQQKLNNQLSADQTVADNKSEDAEQAHQNEIAQITQDFYAKMLQAERDFNLDSLQSREGFYEGLASVEDRGLQLAMSAKFEAATLKSQQIAKDKGADAGDAYLKAAQAAIQKEGQLQGEIDKAEDKKDKKTFDPAKAEYLKGVLALQQAADAEQLKQIEENGSAIANAKDKQLADSASKADAAQEKIALAAERTSDRQITAADKAGKKIDENTARLGKQAAAYDAVAPDAQGPAAPAAGNGTATGSGAQGPASNPIADAIASLKDALAAVERATREAGRGVESAVRSSARSVA